MNTQYLRLSVEYSSFDSGGLRYTRLLHKGAIYTIGGPNIVYERIHPRDDKFDVRNLT